MDSAELTTTLKRRAAELGFSLCGVSPAVSPPGTARLDGWLAAGYAGEMRYLADRREAYADPRNVLDRARSVVMLAMDYRTAEPVATRPGEGRISRYAWGEADYHDIIRERLNQLSDDLCQQWPRARVRGVVDTAPILEREFAQLAGLGWIGKNTLLLNRDRGSWFFLAALLTDIELAYDEPHETDHCGTCRACLDATRCISYLTIELRDAIPDPLRAALGDWLFGCDICQEVCPWNSHSTPTSEQAFVPLPANNPVDLISLFDLDDEAFRARFRHTPLWRPKRRGLLRNAAILLGNRPTPAAIPALIRGLNDDEPLVRGAAAWALGEHEDVTAAKALASRAEIEIEEDVRQEIAAALLEVAVDGRPRQP